MAINENRVKNACNIYLNNGTDSSTGEVRTVRIGLGTLSASDWDAQKAMNIIDALGPCLTKAVYNVQHVATNDLKESV